MHVLKQQRNVLGIGALAWADKVKPGTSEANVRMGREGLTSTDLLMRWADVMRLVWCFCTNILQDLCTELKSHSPCIDCCDEILSELYTVIAAQLASQAQCLGWSIHLLNPLRQKHGIVGDLSGTTVTELN